MKKISFLMFVVILITLLAGCGGGGSSSSPGDGDKTVTNKEILALLDNYKTAVEAYDVNGMLKCLDNSGSFILTINEGSYTDYKDYNALKSELDADKDCQLAWRKSGTADPNGHNYKLELKLGTAVSNNETASGAVVKQTFEVWESSDEIKTPICTDSGTIVWTLAQITGEWKAMAMTINYAYSTSLAGPAKSAAVSINTSNDKRFGFGKVMF
jgi:hypothetical protein